LSLADTPLYRNLKIDPATAEECLQRIVDAREELDRAVTCLI
jgi:hypothetical protein